MKQRKQTKQKKKPVERVVLFPEYEKLQQLKAPDNNYGMYVVPKADGIELLYVKLKLHDDIDKEVPETLVVDGRKTIVGRKEKFIFVVGYETKKNFYATDLYFAEDENGKRSKFFPGVNLSLARSILLGKGFKLLPYQLAGRVDSPDNKSEHNKAMYKCLLENAKHFKIPVHSVQILNQKTREVVYKKLLEK